MNYITTRSSLISLLVLPALTTGILLAMFLWAAPVFAEVPLTIIYSGNLDGELEPCGCSDEGNLGGIKRQTTTLDGIKQQDPNAIILSAGGLITSEGTNDTIKSAYIFKAFSSLGDDAVGVQWNDLSYGVARAIENKIPWVSSNWLSGEFSDSKLISRTINGQRIAVQFFSWLDPTESPVRQMPGAKPVTAESAMRLTSYWIMPKRMAC